MFTEPCPFGGAVRRFFCGWVRKQGASRARLEELCSQR